MGTSAVLELEKCCMRIVYVYSHQLPEWNNSERYIGILYYNKYSTLNFSWKTEGERVEHLESCRSVLKKR